LLQVADQRELGLWLLRIFTTFGWKELCIVTPFFSDVEILERGAISFFIKRLAKSTDVILITRPPETDRQDRLLQNLLTSSVRVYLNEFVHAKLIVAKRSPLSGMAIVGSANLTVSGLSRNIELALITDDPEIIQCLNIEFEKIKIKSKEYL